MVVDSTNVNIGRMTVVKDVELTRRNVSFFGFLRVVGYVIILPFWFVLWAFAYR